MMYAADYMIFCLMLVISLFIGIYYAIQDRNSTQGTEGYLMAGRSMTAIPAGISIAVTFQSALTVLGFPTDVYLYGITFIWCLLAFTLAFFITAGIFVPILYDLRISSVNEYLEKRYGKSVRLLSTFLYLLTNLFYMGANIYGPALTLRRVTGLNLYVAMSTTSLICAIYTTLGGLKGVIWADVLQGLVMVAGLLSVIIRGSMLRGGFGNVIDVAREGGRTTVNYSFDPRFRYTFWTMVVGQIVNWTGICGTNQAQVQRLLSAKNRREAKKALAVGIGGVCLFESLAAMCGLVGYSFFSECDPRLGGCVKGKDEIYPLAVSSMFQGVPGLNGLFLASVYSASLSTVSSGLNSMVTVIMVDLINPHTEWSEATYTVIAKGATFVCGVAILAMGIFSSFSGDIVRLGVGGLSSYIGPCMGIILLGIFCRFLNIWGALMGMICGCAAGMTMFIGSMSLHRPAYLTGFLDVTADRCPINCDFSVNANTTYISIPHAVNSSSDDHLHGMESYYALSVYYVTGVALLFCVTVAVTASLLTGGWKNRHRVSDSLVLHCYKSKNSAEREHQLDGDQVIENGAAIQKNEIFSSEEYQPQLI